MEAFLSRPIFLASGVYVADAQDAPLAVDPSDLHRHRPPCLRFARDRLGQRNHDILVAVEEPGLLILSNHRLVQVGRPPADFVARLSALYEIEDITPKSWDGTAIQRLWGRVQANASGPPTFGVLGIEDQHLHVVTARSAAAIGRAMPADWSAASRGLDVNVLTETILGPLLGIDAAALAAGERVAFTEDVDEAWRRTERTHNLLAFLVNPTRVEQVLAVADAGELMPQKATFFYPKLATGLVINPID